MSLALTGLTMAGIGLGTSIYNQYKAKQERQEINKQRKKEVARLEAREDSAVQRRMVDVQKAGLHPSAVVGGSSAVAHNPAVDNVTQPQYQEDLIKLLLPLAMMYFGGGKGTESVTYGSDGKPLTTTVSRKITP